MNFAHPWVLSLLALLPLFAWLKDKFRRNSAFLYSSVDLVRPVVGLGGSRAESYLTAIRMLALAILIIALAQPRRILGESQVKASGIDIVAAIDMSGSMRSEDYGRDQSRIKMAKEVLTKFIEDRPNDRIGLVAFAKDAYIAAPLTLDHDFLLHNLERMNIGVIDETRTAIGSALATAVNRLDVPGLKDKSKIVILMTDGENNSGKISPLTAAEAAKSLGIKVYTIGIGLRGRAPYPVIDQFGQKHYQYMDADVDEDTLTKIATMTGGKYYRADTAGMFHRIFAEIDKLEKSEVEVKKFQHYDELFQYVIFAGLAAFCFEMILTHTVWRKLP